MVHLLKLLVIGIEWYLTKPSKLWYIYLERVLYSLWSIQTRCVSQFPLPKQITTNERLNFSQSFKTYLGNENFRRWSGLYIVGRLKHSAESFETYWSWWRVPIRLVSFPGVSVKHGIPSSRQHSEGRSIARHVHGPAAILLRKINWSEMHEWLARREYDGGVHHLPCRFSTFLFGLSASSFWSVVSWTRGEDKKLVYNIPAIVVKTTS